MISLLLTLILSFASDSCNNKDIILILGYNYNISRVNDINSWLYRAMYRAIFNSLLCLCILCILTLSVYTMSTQEDVKLQ